jgi:hypothetical protein
MCVSPAAAVLLWDSVGVITAACDVAKVPLKKDSYAPSWSFVVCAVTLVVYAIAVPAVLITMKDN